MPSQPEEQPSGFQVIKSGMNSLIQAQTASGELEPAVFDFEHLTVRAGDSMTCDWSPKEIILVCISGEGCFRAEGQEAELNPGTTILIRPGTAHAFFAWKDCYLILMYRDLT